MFRVSFDKEDHTPKYIYLHKLETLYHGRPIELALHTSLPLRRRLFLLKRWRDERTTFLFESFREHDFQNDVVMQKLQLCIKKLNRKKLFLDRRIEKIKRWEQKIRTKS